MSEEDAINMAIRFKALMPKMTDAQMKTVRTALLEVENRDEANKRIVAYCSTRADFDLASALAAIKDKPDHSQRTTAMIASYGKEEAALQERWKADDARLAKLPPAELEQRVEAALVSLPEHIQTVERRRPQLGRLVKDLIVRDLASAKKTQTEQR